MASDLTTSHRPRVSRLLLARARLAGKLIAVASLVRLWHARRLERRNLRDAPPEMRRELHAGGLNVEREISKPFWRT